MRSTKPEVIVMGDFMVAGDAARLHVLFRIVPVIELNSNNSPPFR